MHPYHMLLVLLASYASANMFSDVVRTVGFANSTDHSYRYCSCCGYHHTTKKPFRPKRTRKDAMCPRCQSLERHRMSCAFFGTFPSLLEQPDDSPFRLLHFGPHSRMDKVISSLHQVDHIRIDYFAEGYTSSTYNRDTYFGDITKLTLFDNFADGAIVLHVLEHLVELAPALNELYRVLKRNAWLLVEVPCMRRDHTGSKPCLGNMTKEERHQCSGQFDHFWSYDCVDFEKQVINHGFSCQKAKDMISDMLTPEAVTKFRLGSGRMFLCRKL